MMPGIKGFFNGIKQVNKEYLLLFVIVILMGLLIYSSTAISQNSPEEVTFSTFYPCPFGIYDTLQSSRYFDFDDVTYFFDPEGNSRLRSLNVTAGIMANLVKGPGNPPSYFINFRTGFATLGEVTANRFTMTGPTPGTVLRGGKFVFDIAEGMKATDCIAGDLVIIGDDLEQGLIKSNKKFDTRIAGIVSTDPKIYMGAAKDKTPLALAGIVKCNVNTENGAIKRGDLLVSSSMPGYAMRASTHEVKPGMLVGKALQTLASGKDQIFVLVNKQ